MRRRNIAVALHDVEPATFDRCALIRDWLSDHGIDRVTLLVIPARDLHPLYQRRPDMAEWLRDCACRGDAIAQHGFHHQRARRPATSVAVRGRGRGEAEFVGMARDDTRRAVEAGGRVLKLAGIEARGFVAPAYAYTPALRSVLGEHFDWWAGLLRLHRGASGRRTMTPPLTLSSSLLRVGATLAGPTLRVDVHPADLGRTRQMLALEAVLRRAHDRTAVTYDDLARA